MMRAAAQHVTRAGADAIVLRLKHDAKGGNLAAAKELRAWIELAKDRGALGDTVVERKS